MKISVKKIRNLWYGLRRNLDKDIFINKNASGTVRFGICLFSRFTVSDKALQVMGDEIQARAIAREVLLHCPQVRQCRIYDTKEAGGIRDDIVFVMWADYPPLKRRPGKYVLWLQNAGFGGRLDEYLKNYDHIFSPSRKICGQNVKISYLPMACEDADFFKRAPFRERFGTDVCFVGNFDIMQRPTQLQRDFMLPAAGYKFGLWGSGWDKSEIELIRRAARGRLDPKDVPAAYSSSKIVLSNHCLVHQAEEMVTTRIYEALACEAFVISDWFGALDEFKDYLVFTSGGKDLEEKLAYYLTHPEKRDEKTRGARAFITKNHTFKNRIKTIANTIGLEFKE